jgi:hypothetical protein
MAGDMTLFSASQFNRLGGIRALAQFDERDQVFEALRAYTTVSRECGNRVI